jgi:type IV secretory pathway VirB10-like protein
MAATFCAWVGEPMIRALLLPPLRASASMPPETTDKRIEAPKRSKKWLSALPSSPPRPRRSVAGEPTSMETPAGVMIRDQTTKARVWPMAAADLYWPIRWEPRGTSTWLPSKPRTSRLTTARTEPGRSLSIAVSSTAGITKPWGTMRVTSRIWLARAVSLAAPATRAAKRSSAEGPSAEERFAARVAGAANDTARASQMRDISRVVPQGFVIPAVLETAIDSDLPGSVRAVVSRDVRGFDGSQVLIPRGSHLIGQYKSAAAIGQTRAFVVWSRIITPTGVSIDVGSPATDRLGRGGLEGKADTHFFQRFGSAILLSVISGGIEALSRNGSNNNALIIGSPSQAQNVAAIALQKQIDIPTTIRVAQGAAVQVSVARDLDFTRVAPVP